MSPTQGLSVSVALPRGHKWRAGTFPEANTIRGHIGIEASHAGGAGVTLALIDPSIATSSTFHGRINSAGTTSPGNAPSATTVGAYPYQSSVSRLDARIACYSWRAPTSPDAFFKPDVGAPGAAGAIRRLNAIDNSSTDTETARPQPLALSASVQSCAAEATLACSTRFDDQRHGRNIGWRDNRDNIVWGNTVYYNLPTWHPGASVSPRKLRGRHQHPLGRWRGWGGDRVQPLEKLDKIVCRDHRQ